jgi:hypothetical protein
MIVKIRIYSHLRISPIWKGLFAPIKSRWTSRLVAAHSIHSVAPEISDLGDSFPLAISRVALRPFCPVPPAADVFLPVVYPDPPSFLQTLSFPGAMLGPSPDRVIFFCA